MAPKPTPRMAAEAILTELDCQVPEKADDVRTLQDVVEFLSRYPHRHIIGRVKHVIRRIHDRHARLDQRGKVLAHALDLDDDAAERTNPRMRPSGEYAILPEDIE